MSTTTKLHGSALAKKFYEDNRAAFHGAGAQPEVKDQYFHTTEEEFDKWLVANGTLEAVATNFPSDTKERYGIVQLRNQARAMMNRWALKAKDFPAYTIGRSLKGRMRIKLFGLYVKDAPGEIAHGVRAWTSYSRRRLMQLAQQIKQADAQLPDDVRLSTEFHIGNLAPYFNFFDELANIIEGKVRGVPPLAAPAAKPKRGRGKRR